MKRKLIAFLVIFTLFVTCLPLTTVAKGKVNGNTGSNTYITGGNYDNGGGFGTPIVVQNAIKEASNPPKTQTAYSATPKNNNNTGGTKPTLPSAGGGTSGNTIAQESYGGGDGGGSYVSYDLTVTKIVPASGYRVNMSAVTAVSVRNDSGGDLSNVLVELKIDGATPISKRIDINAGETAVAVFPWVVKATSTHDLFAEVNSDRSVSETDYSNNTKDQTVNVTGSWPSATDIFYDTKTDIGLRPNGYSNPSVSWKDNGKDCWANITMTTTVHPDIKGTTAMKSGYGFTVDVHTEVTSNSIGSVYGPQAVFMFVPEFQYAYIWELEPTQTRGSLVNDWHFVVNPTSTIGARKWYIPIWFPDKKNYEPIFTAFGAFTPAGELMESNYPTILIDGNMYEDDKTTNGWSY